MHAQTHAQTPNKIWRFYRVHRKHNGGPSITLKMICLYLLGQHCLHITFQPHLGSGTYSSGYEKLPNIVIHASKNITETMQLLKMCGSQIRFCLFMFRPIASKQLL